MPSPPPMEPVVSPAMDRLAKVRNCAPMTATQRLQIAGLLLGYSGLGCLPRLRPRSFPGCHAAAPLRLHRPSREHSPRRRTAARGPKPLLAADHYRVDRVLERSFVPASRSLPISNRALAAEAARARSNR